MLFILATVVFVLALFGVTIGSANLTLLGLALLAAGHVWGWSPWPPRRPR